MSRSWWEQQTRTLSRLTLNSHPQSALRLLRTSCGRYDCYVSVIIQLWVYIELETWANAQRDGRPAEYRWRPLFNAAKFGWRPLLECRAVTLPKRETRWNLQGCLSQRPSPCCATQRQTTKHYSDSSVGDGAQMAIFWRFCGSLHFQRAARSTFQTCIHSFILFEQ